MSGNSLSPDINGEPRSASDLLLSDLLVQSQQSLLLTAPLPDHSSTNTNPFAIIPDASSVFSVGAGGATFSSEDTRRLEQALRVDPNPRPVGYNSKYSYGEPLIESSFKRAVSAPTRPVARRRPTHRPRDFDSESRFTGDRDTYSRSNNALGAVGPTASLPQRPYPDSALFRIVTGSPGESGNLESHLGFLEPSFGIPVAALGAVEVCATPVREPPAWRLNYRIGSGACGTVFLEKVQTRQMEFPELWAVKRIPRALPNFPIKRYQAEIKNLQALSEHEWFVKFHSSYEDTDYFYIAMEYVPIGDMSVTFVDGYRWSERDTKVVIEQLLRGLAVMHKEGITHRDLKPENIFLYLPEKHTSVLHVKIGDFGTSKRIPLTNTSTYLKTTTGTQGYMAPEAHDTSKPKTNRVDIWSLGCILYRMFAGSLLFKDPVETWKYAMAETSTLLGVENIGLSDPCVCFLRDVLQPSPEDRPSAEACLEKDWIADEVTRSDTIGRDLYVRLCKIHMAAPDLHSLPDMVANQAVDSGY